MPAYGPYETTREIASGHGAIVYSARKAGEPRDNYVVKVFALDTFLHPEPEDRAEIESLVEEFNRTFARSVELQRQAAAASRHVAPILDVGREEHSAWYATRLYPRTVQKILEGRVALAKEWIYHIVSSVAAGALDFKKTCGRSHGDIRPSNVLIGASQKVRDAAVVLSDPLPGDASEAARYELADLNAVGQIIYQLVRRREADALDHSILPLQPSAEWTSVFGEETEAWLSLCNRLLDPNLSTETYPLERLASDLAKLQPKPPVTGKMIAIAAVVAVMAIVGGGLLKFYLGRGALTLASDPPGARIIFNGEVLPQPAPVKLKPAKGKHQVRAEYPGLDAKTMELEITGGRQEARIVLDYGGVVLESDPPNASILVEGTNLVVGGAPAETPLRLPVVKPGEIIYQLSLKDHLSTNVKVTIRSGFTNRLPIVKLIARRVGDGEVKFTSIPIGAAVYLDQKPFAVTREDKYLPPGSYTFTAYFRDVWPPKEVKVQVRPNAQTNAHFYFERGRLTLESEPSGAQVWVSNKLVAVTPTNSFLWPTGVVRFRFEKTGFEPTNVTVHISRDLEEVALLPRLTSTNGVILLTVEQAPAVVRDARNGEELLRTVPGQTNELTRPPGPFSVTIEAVGRQPVTTNILFVSKQRIPLNIRLPVELVPVAFSSDPPSVPPGVELVDAADGLALGSLDSVNASGLPAHGYKLAARHLRYPTLGWTTNDVTVMKGRTNAHLFRFHYTLLTLTSSPPDLKVMVYEVLESGRRELIGATPTNRPYHRPGLIRLEFVKWDGTETNPLAFTLWPGVTNVGTRFRPPKPRAYVNSLGMVFEWIPKEGTDEGFWAGKYEVTQREYELIMGAGATIFKHGKNPVLTNLPADSVTLAQAVEFCQRLTQQDATTLAGQGKGGWKYTLPSTNQFNQYAELTLANAVINRGPGARPDPVHLLATNELGLAGVRGNLWEWCSEGVARGGAYDSVTRGLYARMLTNLYFALPSDPNQLFFFNVGFRCILVPPGSASR